MYSKQYIVDPYGYNSVCTQLLVPLPVFTRRAYVRTADYDVSHGAAVVAVLHQVRWTTGSTQTSGGHRTRVVVLVHPVLKVYISIVYDVPDRGLRIDGIIPMHVQQQQQQHNWKTQQQQQQQDTSTRTSYSSASRRPSELWDRRGEVSQQVYQLGGGGRGPATFGT